MRVFVYVLVASVCLAVPGWGRHVKGGGLTAHFAHTLPPPPTYLETQVEGVEEESGVPQVVEQSLDTDDKKNDPDWLPDESDYYYDDTYDDEEYSGDDEDDEEYSDDDEDDEEYSDEDEGPHDEDYYNDYLDDLWTSDDDPDWLPTQEQRYQLLVEKLAQLMLGTLKQQARGRGQVNGDHQQLPSLEDVEHTIRNLNMNITDLTQVYLHLRHTDSQENELSQETVSQEDLSHKNEVDTSRATYYSKSRRRMRRSTPVQVQATWPGAVSQNKQSRTGQVTQDEDAINYYGTWGEIQELNHGQHQGQRWGVGEGVEPYVPGRPQVDVGTGVEPEVQEDAGGDGRERPSFIGWLQNSWGKVSDAADELGDVAGDTLNRWGDRVEKKFDRWGNRTDETLDKVGDTLSNVAGHVVDKVHHAVHKVGGGLKNVGQFLVTAFTKFGILVQEGAKYCIRRLTHVHDQVKGSEILDKLEQKLSEGNAQVARLFQLIGEKMDRWRATHLAQNVDEGLVVLEVEGGSQVEGGHQHGNIVEEMPNFFQDDDVVLLLNKLVEIEVLSQDDLQFISEVHDDHSQQSQQSKQSQQYSQQGQRDAYWS